MEEKKIKGSLLVDFVRMIRTFKDLDWNKYLKPEDWQVINSIVLPSKWYPLELYKRCSWAGFMLLAKGNLEVARANGQMSAKRMFESTYKSVVAAKDPLKALNQFVMTWSSLSNFSMIRFEKITDKQAKIHRMDYDQQGEEAFCQQMAGMFETAVEMTGGKNCKVILSSKKWQGAPDTTFDINWE